MGDSDDRIPERSYGLTESEAIGTPTASDAGGAHPCPNCGCARVMVISVKVRTKLIVGGTGDGTYLGCPACPWASPMVVVPPRKDGGIG